MAQRDRKLNSSVAARALADSVNTLSPFLINSFETAPFSPHLLPRFSARQPRASPDTGMARMTTGPIHNTSHAVA